MYCGYWNCHNKIKGDYSAVKNGEMYDLDIYLHGFCDIFATELARKMQEQGIPFEICIIVNENGLVHCFLWIESPEEDINYYIDVRGITSDENEFFDDFADFFDYYSWEQGENCGEEDQWHLDTCIFHEDNCIIACHSGKSGIKLNILCSFFGTFLDILLINSYTYK